MASEYHRGDMDIHEQTSTYHLFVMLTKWGSLSLAALLVFLVLVFCTPTSFVGALAVVIANFSSGRTRSNSRAATPRASISRISPPPRLSGDNGAAMLA